MPRLLAFVLCLFFGAVLARADGPQDNIPDNVRPIPAKGVAVPDDVRAGLHQKLAELQQAIAGLSQKNDPRTRELLPDVQIFERAVADVLKYDEFQNVREFPIATRLLDMGLERAQQLQQGQGPWAAQTGLVVRGFVSKLDGSVQPYGLVVPESYTATGTQRHRLDIWLHGRNENVLEVGFLGQRVRDRGTFAPPDTIVLHPYGRYSNAFKFAGEVDVFEALADVQKKYRVDDDRIAMRGFSMGGAGCWQFAVHHADRWVAANPGAGFCETQRFLNFFQNEKLKPAAWEETLWRMYDCDICALNLAQCPTVAYSGEIDRQKQAADIMAEALAKYGIELTHLIGPKTAHAYHPATRDEVDRRIALIAERGRERVPREVHLVTYTLKYNRMTWVTIDALGEHWKEARVDARLSGENEVTITTKNVAGLTLAFEPGRAPLQAGRMVKVVIDSYELKTRGPESDRSWSRSFVKDGRWEAASAGDSKANSKRHDLQGPIDDAFMDSFIFVRPTGKFANPVVEKWVRAELDHAIEHWRRQFRGVARVKDDTEITDKDIESANLVLWGDPSSNTLLGRIADKLPIRWSTTEIVAGDKRFAAEGHAPILIHPNPLNPNRYVVLNSSFTYREYDYLNNARQVPKLPDWAIVDLSVSPNSRYPGKIVAADFFDEAWQIKRMGK